MAAMGAAVAALVAGGAVAQVACSDDRSDAHSGAGPHGFVGIPLDSGDNGWSLPSPSSDETSSVHHGDGSPRAAPAKRAPLPIGEVSKRLKARLQDVRQTASTAGVGYTNVSLHFPKANDPRGVFAFHFDVPATSAMATLNALLTGLQHTDAAVFQPPPPPVVAAQPAHEGGGDGAHGSRPYLSLLLQDRQSGALAGSVVLEASPAPGAPRQFVYSITMYRDDGFTDGDVQAVADAYCSLTKAQIRASKASGGSPSTSLPPAVRQKFQQLGVQVYDRESQAAMDWSCLPGYSHIQNAIDEHLLLHLKHPNHYADVVKATRARPSSADNRVGALLFCGPPGTGKTTAARIIAAEANVPMVGCSCGTLRLVRWADPHAHLGVIRCMCRQKTSRRSGMAKNKRTWVPCLRQLTVSREGALFSLTR